MARGFLVQVGLGVVGALCPLYASLIYPWSASARTTKEVEQTTMTMVGQRLDSNKSETEPTIPMPHTMRLPKCLTSPSLSNPSSLLTSTDKGELDAEMLALALANRVPCSGSANTIERLAAAAVAPLVLMNDGERQVGCLEYVLLIYLCVEERWLLGGTSVDELVWY